MNSRKSFDTAVVLISWSIWLERNARTFNRQNRSNAQMVVYIMEEAATWAQARYATFITGTQHPVPTLATGTASNTAGVQNSGRELLAA